MADLHVKEYKRFEDIKHTGSDGSEYWHARELAPVLEYKRWENFSKAINRSMLACKNSGFAFDDHFREVTKTIPMPKKAAKAIYTDRLQH